MSKPQKLYDIAYALANIIRNTDFEVGRWELHVQSVKLTKLFIVLWSCAIPVVVSSNQTPAKVAVLKTQESLAQIVHAELDQFIEQTQSSDKKLTGITIAVSLPYGQLLSSAYGHADLENDIPMAIDTRMPVGSIGKIWTASVALTLVHEGILDLDEPIRRWLGTEPWFDQLPNYDTLTLRQLLNHSGGIIDHVFESNDFLDWFKGSVEGEKTSLRSFTEIDSADRAFDHRELVQYSLNKAPLFKPGESFHYTDTGYILAGLIIEVASGKSYYKLLKNRFINPLGLTMTSAMDSRHMPGVAQGYCVQSRTLLGLPETVLNNERLIFNPLIEWTGGGVVSNSQDLARWAKALFKHETALPAKALEEMLLSVVDQGIAKDEFGRHRGYGLGVSIVRTAQGTAFRHGGFFPGYLSMMAYYPDSNVAIAMQINSDGADLETLFNDVQNLIFRMLE